MTEFGALGLVASSLVTGTSVSVLVVLDWNPQLQDELAHRWHELPHRARLIAWLMWLAVLYSLMGISVRTTQAILWTLWSLTDLWFPSVARQLDQELATLSKYAGLRTYRARHAG